MVDTVIVIDPARVYRFQRELGPSVLNASRAVTGCRAIHDSHGLLIGFAEIVESMHALWAHAVISYATPERLGLESEPDKWALWSVLDMVGNRGISHLILERKP